MADPNLSEIATTTLKHRSKVIADNCTNNIALFNLIKKKGNMKLVSGGEKIVRPLEYALNGTAGYYSGYDTIDITPQNVVSAAEVEWKQAAVSVVCSGLEVDIQNTGKEGIIDLLEARIKNAEKALFNLLNTGAYSDGTGSGSKQIDGLQKYVADSPGATVAGIADGTYSWWQNNVYDCSTDYGAAMSASNVQEIMNNAMKEVVRNNERPDVILADNNYFGFFEQSLQAIQRVTRSDVADSGFQSLEYAGIPVILDGGKDGACPSNHMYFLNTDYIYLATAKKRNFVPLNPDRHAVNQDAVVDWPCESATIH